MDEFLRGKRREKGKQGMEGEGRDKKGKEEKRNHGEFLCLED